MPRPEPPALGILLLGGSYERAHHAFMLAAGAGSMGRPVVLFASNRGCLALCRDWSLLDGAADDARVRARGVAGLEELREAAMELGASLLACDSGLRIAELDPASLCDGVVVSGIPAFLSAVGAGQIISL